ncbi:hypothetical protein LSH36_135g05069 [Paralvinella palmiformis]|uniref:Uncharacterized protein n=1 Tax=Paralvinella palmiformis TaxID=53620 RepID=A0AAD9JW15_9ANNE|nr:hypothetical protein LSH36_135g05069 [Paralvinella palmiformis]
MEDRWVKHPTSASSQAYKSEAMSSAADYILIAVPREHSATSFRVKLQYTICYNTQYSPTYVLITKLAPDPGCECRLRADGEPPYQLTTLWTTRPSAYRRAGTAVEVTSKRYAVVGYIRRMYVQRPQNGGLVRLTDLVSVATPTISDTPLFTGRRRCP